MSQLSQVMLLAEDALRAVSPAEASTRFFASAARLGATYLQTRHYQRPSARLTSATHWNAGGFIKRIAPADWPGSAAFNYICFDCNPLLAAIRESRTTYRFSDFASFDDDNFSSYWEALSEAGIADAVCATSYGNAGAITSLHLGVDDREVDRATAWSLQLAGLMLTEHLMRMADAFETPAPALTPRERDCLCFVADGLRDRDISDALKISEQTVRFHIDNARRKLDATSRAQAVARLANLQLI